MRLSDIVDLGFRYLGIGVLLLTIIGIGFGLWYFLYFKKKRTDRKFKVGKILLAGAFVVYLVIVIGATMLSRGDFYGNTKIYPLFYSYKDAWNDFSMTEWRNIILNILMFVPLGIILPCLIKKMQSFWKVYLVGLGFTCLIEIIQLLLKRGIFEPDDILGNTVGAMIGYGVFGLGKYIVGCVKNNTREKGVQVFCLQIPFLVAVALFSSIFIVYHMQELGNLDCAFILKQKNISVTSDLNFEETTPQVMVYKAKVLSVEQTEEIANELFARQNCTIDENRTDIYENSAIYYSDSEKGGNRFSIWFEYDGGTFRLTDFEKGFFDEEGQVKLKTDASEEEIRQALTEAGIFVPEAAEFENKGEGTYSFVANRTDEDKVMYDGQLKCVYYEDGQFGLIENRMMELNGYKEIDVISQQEAYEKLKAGEFSYWRVDDNLLNIQVEEVQMEYRLDTKGFYQPVYVFDTYVNEEQRELIIPAINKNFSNST